MNRPISTFCAQLLRSWLIRLFCVFIIFSSGLNSWADEHNGKPIGHPEDGESFYGAGAPWDEQIKNYPGTEDYGWAGRLWNQQGDDSGGTHRMSPPLEGLQGKKLEALAKTCLSLDPTKRDLPRLLSCAVHKVITWYYRNEYLAKGPGQMPDSCLRVSRTFVELVKLMELPHVEVGYVGIPDHQVNRISYEVNGQVYSYIVDVSQSLLATAFHPYTKSSIDYHQSHGEDLPVAEAPKSDADILAGILNPRPQIRPTSLAAGRAKASRMIEGIRLLTSDSRSALSSMP